MAGPVKFTDDHVTRMRALAAAGKSLNQIAVNLGFSPSTVSRHAKKHGVLFDREQTAVAVQAIRVDADKRHQELRVRLIERAHIKLDRIDEPRLRLTVLHDGTRVFTRVPPDDADELKAVSVVARASAEARRIREAYSDVAERDDSALDRFEDHLFGSPEAGE